ncbi:MAG: ABC transporter substrate-binding protein [Geminicoccaceae bacterium]|nr:MAG: ABC transporter substrate-binding protein [Geminicoccaceae bacterium]
MKRLPLTVACGNYDRTRAIWDGRVPIEGTDTTYVYLEAEEAFHRAFKFAEFDVSEISFSSHMMMASRGASPYVGIPAFVSRVFRHSAIYVRADAGIERPEDLAGRRVGLPEYQLTACLWVRGILQDEHGVRPQAVTWFSGGQEETGRGERAPLQLPPDIDCRRIPPDRTLVDMLAAGELDALVTARAPSSFVRGEPHVRRLFPDYVAAERAYFERTRMFPIMHLIGIRRDLVERHPWLPVSVYKAFVEARRLARADLEEIGCLRVMHPWIYAHTQDLIGLMGKDFWPYGIEANRRELEAMMRWSHEQGLAARPLALEDLFAPSTLDLARI